MATAIRSAVIELGIRQLEAKLTPPDVATILQAQKAFESMGNSAQRSFSIATEEWGQFAVTVREMQQELLRTGDSFEKVLADAVAWEDALPGVTAATRDATKAGGAHALTLTEQLRGLSHVEHGAMLASRGVLFLLASDKEHQAAMIDKLFVLQGTYETTRGLYLMYVDLAKALKGATVASLAFKLANPEYVALAGVIAAIAFAFGALSNVLTANSNAMKNFTDETIKGAEHGQKLAEILQMQAEAAYNAKDRISDLNAANTELYTQRLKLEALSAEAQSRGYFKESMEAEKEAVAVEEKRIANAQKLGEAQRYQLEQEIKINEQKMQQLRIESDIDNKERDRRAALFGMGPEGRAKLQFALQSAGGSQLGNIQGTNEFELDILAHAPDPNLQIRAQREQARRYRTSPLFQTIEGIPHDPETDRQEQLQHLGVRNTRLNAQIEELPQRLDRVLTGMLNVLKAMEGRIKEIDDAARANKAGGAWSGAMAGARGGAR